MKKTVARMLALFLLLLPLPAVPSYAAKNKAEEKEPVVVMPLIASGVERDMIANFENSLIESLSPKYKVYYGKKVQDAVEKVYRQQSAAAKPGAQCDDTKCLQNIAIAFQSELIAVCNVKKTASGFMLSLKIQNVIEDTVVLSKNVPCKNCDDFAAMQALQGIVSGQAVVQAAPPVVVNTPPSVPEGMVFVKGGCFDMGDTFGDGEADEKPVHRVCLSDFKMDKYEATNAEFERYKPGFKESRNADYEGVKVSLKASAGDRNPVVDLTWDESKGYCESVGKRLPTEAEWEYSARSGGKNEKWAGTGDESRLGDYAWFSGNSGSNTHPVGEKKPNGLGLYDMSGNVWEWVADWYDENYYKQGVEQNPKGPSSGQSRRVLRGGSWLDDAGLLRTANRSLNSPGLRNDSVGFRCAQY